MICFPLSLLCPALDAQLSLRGFARQESRDPARGGVLALTYTEKALVPPRVTAAAVLARVLNPVRLPIGRSGSRGFARES